jgi:hypothetical protein
MRDIKSSNKKLFKNFFLPPFTFIFYLFLLFSSPEGQEDTSFSS